VTALKDRILAARAEAQRARDDPFNVTGGGGGASSSVFVRHEAYSYPTSAQVEASLAKAAKLDESIVELQGQLPAAREKAEADKAVLDKVRLGLWAFKGLRGCVRVGTIYGYFTRKKRGVSSVITNPCFVYLYHMREQLREVGLVSFGCLTFTF